MRHGFGLRFEFTVFAFSLSLNELRLLMLFCLGTFNVVAGVEGGRRGVKNETLVGFCGVAIRDMGVDCATGTGLWVFDKDLTEAFGDF